MGSLVVLQTVFGLRFITIGLPCFTSFSLYILVQYRLSLPPAAGRNPRRSLQQPIGSPEGASSGR